MNTHIDSLIDSSLIAEATFTPTVEAKPKPKSTRTRSKKEKPYKAIHTLAAHSSSKKEEKKAQRNGKAPVRSSGVKKVSSNKASNKQSSKAAEKEAARKEAAKFTGVATGNEKCVVCGKPISRGSSITQGMGDECARQVKRLPAGMTMSEHFDTFKVVELPKGYISWKEAVAAAQAKGVSGYQFMIACGGNRMLRPPLNDNFQVIVFKNTRYVPKASVSDKALAELKKPAKEEKPAKKAGSKKAPKKSA